MKKKLKIIALLLFTAIVLLVFVPNFIIQKNAANKTFSGISKIPENKVGLVLGTAKYVKNHRVNPYFTYRVQAAVKLYKAGKIQFILISGDNGSKTYDEPSDFKKALIKNGIPETKIFLDYAGFRTLDSVVRAKAVFGQNSLTIISQKFHNERAIFLAEKNGIKAVGFNAKDLTGKYGLRVKIREYFARTKAFLDVLFHVKPKFLGKSIKIE